MSEETRTAVATALAAANVTYTAVFVPQSLSRNSAEKVNTINWRVTLAHGMESMAFDYQAGIGNIPNYKHGRTNDHAAADHEASEQGRYQPPGRFIGRRIPAPHVADICHSLTADDTRGESFEDWAANFGYDADSRKAEEIYNACRKQTRDAERVLGRALLAELQTLLQDY